MAANSPCLNLTSPSSSSLSSPSPVEAIWSKRPITPDLNGFIPDATDPLLDQSIYTPTISQTQPSPDKKITLVTSTPTSRTMIKDATTLSPFWKTNDRPKVNRRRSYTISGRPEWSKETSDKKCKQLCSAMKRRPQSRSEQTKLIDRSLSDSDSISEFSFMDQESPVTNRISSPIISSTHEQQHDGTSDDSSRLVSNPSSSCLLCPDDSCADLRPQSGQLLKDNSNQNVTNAEHRDAASDQMSLVNSKPDQLWFDVPIICAENASNYEMGANLAESNSFLTPEKTIRPDQTASAQSGSGYVLLTFQPPQQIEQRPEVRCNCDQFDWKRASVDSIEMLHKDLHSQRIVAKSLLKFAIQVMIPLGICGFGNLAAGLLLDRVQQLRVFAVLSELYIAIPCLMGLKGNLEMTMASRLSTAANLKRLERLDQIISITKGNLCLLQVQATVVSLIASSISVLVYIKNTYTFQLDHAVVLVASNVITANVACTFLSLIMILIVIICNRTNVDPDNVATPIASSLGDVVTVALIAAVSSSLFDQIEFQRGWLNLLILLIILFITPISTLIAYRNEHTRSVLCDGWWPILLSMIISSLAGMILDKAIALFVGFALVQPLINGMGGNLAAIQASRISTYVNRKLTDQDFVQKTFQARQLLCEKHGVRLRENHEEQIYVELIDQEDEEDEEEQGKEGNRVHANNGNKSIRSLSNGLPTVANGRPSLSRSLSCERQVKMSEEDFRQMLLDSQCAKILILIAIPMHVIYYYTILLLKGTGSFDHQPFFLVIYLIAAIIQMTILLYCARTLVYWMWSKKINPDDSIPLLSSFGDLLGTGLLTAAFFVLNPSRFW